MGNKPSAKGKGGTGNVLLAIDPKQYNLIVDPAACKGIYPKIPAHETPKEAMQIALLFRKAEKANELHDLHPVPLVRYDPAHTSSGKFVCPACGYVLVTKSKLKDNNPKILEIVKEHLNDNGFEEMSNQPRVFDKTNWTADEIKRNNLRHIMYKNLYIKVTQEWKAHVLADKDNADDVQTELEQRSKEYNKAKSRENLREPTSDIKPISDVKQTGKLEGLRALADTNSQNETETLLPETPTPDPASPPINASGTNSDDEDLGYKPTVSAWGSRFPSRSKGADDQTTVDDGSLNTNAPPIGTQNDDPPVQPRPGFGAMNNENQDSNSWTISKGNLTEPEERRRLAQLSGLNDYDSPTYVFEFTILGGALILVSYLLYRCLRKTREPLIPHYE